MYASVIRLSVGSLNDLLYISLFGLLKGFAHSHILYFKLSKTDHHCHICGLPFCFVLFIFFHQPIKDATIIPTGKEKKKHIHSVCSCLWMFVAT